MPAVDPLAVKAALQDSMAAHRLASAPPRGKRPDNWLEALQRAYTLRKAAHAMDPQHTAPAWEDEQALTPRGEDTHRSLLRFYKERLGMARRPKATDPRVRK